MPKTDILIIGGGPGGMIAGVTARKHNPAKKITLVRQEEKGVIPCGIPYIFRRLDSVEKNLAPDKPLEMNKIDLIIDQAIKIDSEQKIVSLSKGGELAYEKLILATGSEPVLIPIPGADKKKVWLIKKDCDYLAKLRQEVLASKKIVIIGGGFIGVEMAEELSGIDGLDITMVEMLNHCLIRNFDQEFAAAAEERLKQQGVKIYTKTAVKEIGGEDRVEYLKFEDGKQISADLVIMSVGARPNIDLAQEADIEADERGGIYVDKYMRTNKEDIFACGDCAQTKDFVTQKPISCMLASVATYEARIAGSNLYQLTQENKGTIGAFSTFINGLVLAAAGLNETRAKDEALETLIGASEVPNHHPGTLPDTETISLKLIFSKSSKELIGGEVRGPESVAEMINILALAIQQKTSLDEFKTLQVATHPLLTAAPTVYPLIKAAQSCK